MTRMVRRNVIVGRSYRPRLCDVSLCVLLHGLCESSVLSVEAANVTFTATTITSRLSIVKGRAASTVDLLRFTKDGDAPSPMNLWEKWASMRGDHVRFFALPEESVKWQAQLLNMVLHQALERLPINVPTGAKYSSHSMQIGSHTEQVMLGIPLEVCLSRFGWGPSSGRMAQVYFDRTILSSDASVGIFGAAVFPSRVVVGAVSASSS